MNTDHKDHDAETLYKSLVRTMEKGIEPGKRYGNVLTQGISSEWKAKFEALGAVIEPVRPESTCGFHNPDAVKVSFTAPVPVKAQTVESINQVMRAVEQQMLKMRVVKGHTVEDDVKHNSNYELIRAVEIITDPGNTNWSVEDRLEWAEQIMPNWDQNWLERTFHKTYKDRLKVGISLLIAELERVMYLENKRIKNNDSSTASNAGDPESNG